MKAEVLSLPGEALVKAEVLFELFSGEDRFVVCIAGGEQVVEDACQLVSRCGNGLRSPEPGPHGAVEVAQVGSASRQGLGGKA